MFDSCELVCHSYDPCRLTSSFSPPRNRFLRVKPNFNSGPIRPMVRFTKFVSTYTSHGLSNVQFSVSETEYLNILAKAMEEGTLEQGDAQGPPPVNITLSNGSVYPLKGKITAADRSFNDNSGSLTIKALFSNPYAVLLPGMFVRVNILDIVANNAILVPQRSVQQLLEESFVLVVGDDGKSVSKKVVLGEKVGSYYIVKSGLTKDDTVIVDGLTNLQSGKDLNVTMVTADEMGFSLKESTDVVNKS